MGRETELFSRGVEAIYPSPKALEHQLSSGKKLKIYLGIDPTAAEIHLGHTILLRKLREFQDLGHHIILLIGDFTGLIGDPTDKTATRQPLTREQVKKNAENYKEQAAKILDFSNNKAEIKYNSQWLAKMTFEDWLKIASHFTLQQLLERDMFQKRLKERKPIGLNEFLYPLMQGYDSVEMEVDMEVGGTDQTFNMLFGREMLNRLKDKEKFVLTAPLIEGTDGQKMSKSLNNTIAINAAPDDMFGKLMSIQDSLVTRYMELLTDIPTEEIKKLEGQLKKGSLNPMEAKKQLAVKLVSMYHSLQEAKKAEAEFRRVFQEKGTPAAKDYSLGNKETSLVDLLVSGELASSRSEAKRLITQGGVLVNGEKISDETLVISPKNNTTIQVGKFKALRIK